MAGTPSWLLIFFERLAETAGSRSGRVADIWPRLEMLSHGGVAWAPYRDRFAALLEGSGAETREVYPASEGFFGIADRGDGEGLRLLLDTGIFYEFIPLDRAGQRRAGLPLDRRRGAGRQLRAGRHHLRGPLALPRRRHGDPGRARPAARPRHRADELHAVRFRRACDRRRGRARRGGGCERPSARRSRDFSAGSLFPEEAGQRGGHLYIVEFGAEPVGTGPGAERQARFAETLDVALCRLNDDYDAHRAGGYGLDAARVRIMPPGGFAAWMKSRGRLGGQNKVPRIVNDRELFAALRVFADAYGESPPN